MRESHAGSVAPRAKELDGGVQARWSVLMAALRRAEGSLVQAELVTVSGAKTAAVHRRGSPTRPAHGGAVAGPQAIAARRAGLAKKPSAQTANDHDATVDVSPSRRRPSNRAATGRQSAMSRSPCSGLRESALGGRECRTAGSHGLANLGGAKAVRSRRCHHRRSSLQSLPMMDASDSASARAAVR